MDVSNSASQIPARQAEHLGSLHAAQETRQSALYFLI